MRFVIEQLAVNFSDGDQAAQLLHVLGWREWTMDEVIADGQVRGSPAVNKALLRFNYQSSPDVRQPLEFELLSYESGPNWLSNAEPPNVSHIGMHCAEDELNDWERKLTGIGLQVVQRVDTVHHTNPHIANSRRYTYTIFGASHLIGFDLKFIVRRNLAP